MVHAIAAQFPFTGGGSLAPYHPSAVERYFPIAPGIEISVEPGDGLRWAGDPEPSVYNLKGRLITSAKKGTWIDTYR